MTISAIVSAYYAKNYIERRIENLLSLEVEPEIVVVAKRGSAEARISHKYDVVTVETSGIPTIYAAWNMAIRAASGSYITNANCDDYTYRYTLSDMAAILNERPQVSIVYGDNFIVEGNRKTYHRRQHGDYEFLKDHCFVGPMPMWRKSLHDKYGLFADQYQVCGDYEFWLRVASYGETIYHADIVSGEYERRVDSAEHRNPKLAQDEKRFIQSFYRPIAIRKGI